MISKLFPVFILLQFAILRGAHSQNATQIPPNELTQAVLGLASNTTTPIPKNGFSLGNETRLGQTSTERSTNIFQKEITTEKAEDIKSSNFSDVPPEIKDIFNVDSRNTSDVFDEDEFNSTTVFNCQQANSTNFICLEENMNETASNNYTMVAEAMESSEHHPNFRLQKSAAIAAGVFLLSAIAGYLSCVTYRRYLQNKYGNSQRVAPEDVYDTTDLRYFEI